VLSIRLLKRGAALLYDWCGMNQWLYILLCVFVPLVWGLAVAAISRRIDEWAKKRRNAGAGNVMHPDDPTRIDYHI